MMNGLIALVKSLKSTWIFLNLVNQISRSSIEAEYVSSSKGLKMLLRRTTLSLTNKKKTKEKMV